MITEIKTTDDWLNCKHPGPMLEYLESIGVIGTHYKRWFIAGAFLRLTEFLVDDEVCLAAADYCRRRGDGKARPDECAAVPAAVEEKYESLRRIMEVWSGSDQSPSLLALSSAFHAVGPGGPRLDIVARSIAVAWGRSEFEPIVGNLGDAIWEHDEPDWEIPTLEDHDRDPEAYLDKCADLWMGRAYREQASMIREVIGNPFQLWPFDGAWRTPEVLELALRIHTDPHFNKEPLLARTLIGAGCSCAAVIEHLRAGAAPHEHGCWAIDLILGTGGGPVYR